jgi:hypothetical protein
MDTTQSRDPRRPNRRSPRIRNKNEKAGDWRPKGRRLPTTAVDFREMVMGKIILFHGVSEVLAAHDSEPALDLDAVLVHQSDLLVRWKAFGEELKRRSECPLPFDLALDLYDLLNETDD